MLLFICSINNLFHNIKKFKLPENNRLAVRIAVRSISYSAQILNITSVTGKIICMVENQGLTITFKYTLNGQTNPDLQNYNVIFF